MEDIAQTLQDILGSEEGQQKLKGLIEMFGDGNDGIDLSMLEGMLSSAQNQSAPSNSSANNEKPPDGGLDLQALMGIGRMMEQVNKPDSKTELIRALKPLLCPERQKKADTAIKILRLLSLLPLLRESGLLDNFNL